VSARESWLAAWQRRSPRERALIALAAVVVAGTAGYAALYLPLARGLDAGERAATRARAEVLVARRLADEVAGLAREPHRAQTADLRAAVARVAAGSGLRDALTAIDASEASVRIASLIGCSG